jgi:hypothetical protein
VRWLSLEEALVDAEKNAWVANYGRLSVKGRVAAFGRLVVEGATRCVLAGVPIRHRNKPLDAVRLELVYKFAEAHEEVVSVLVRCCFDKETLPAGIAAGYHSFLEWLSRWLLVGTFGVGCRILADNSRFTRAMAALIDSEELIEAAGGMNAVRDCFLSVAGPNAVVHVVCDPDEVVARVARRRDGGFVHPSHAGRADEDIRCYTKRWNEINANAARLFALWGVPILSVDANEPPERNAEAVISFLDGILDGED